MVGLSKDFCHKLLLMKNNQLTPEAKYLLIRILFLYGNTTLTLSTKEVVKQFGISDAVFRKARGLLLDLGYLKDTKSDPEFVRTVGRPRVKIQLTQLLFDDLDGMNVKSRCLDHDPRLESLLFWGVGNDFLRSINKKKIKSESQAVQSSGHTFTAATRILLAVLYLHADVCGAVRNLGLVEVSKFTGMSSDRLESQLGIIEDMGYLLGRVSGITYSQIFGHAKGIFFLNVCSDNLGGAEAPSLWLALNTTAINHYNQYYLGFRVYKFIKDLKDKFYYSANDVSSLIKYVTTDDSQCDVDWGDRLPELLQNIRKMLEEKGLYFRDYKNYVIDPTNFYAGGLNVQLIEWVQLFAPYKLHEFFPDKVTVSLLKYLHSQIDYFASLLLEKSGRQITLETLYVDDSVLCEIELNVFPFKDKGNGSIDSSKKMALIFFIYCISYQHALIVKALLSCALPSKISFDKAKFAFLPSKLKNHFSGTSFLISIHLIGQKESVEKIWAVQFGGKDPKEALSLKPYCVRLFEEDCIAAFDNHGYDLNLLNQIGADFSSDSDSKDSVISANFPS